MQYAGMSMALGAFLAGVMLAGSNYTTDSMKVVITKGFIWFFRLLYRSRVPEMERSEGHGSVAAGD
jgi:hypothetical protein